ncbi:MAG: hypothetical protein Q8Q09_13455 [Deltaproteobacteria bacterium]|nr:hypothetical protein [Deltaproteobacteria bacterium]
MLSREWLCVVALWSVGCAARVSAEDAGDSGVDASQDRVVMSSDVVVPPPPRGGRGVVCTQDSECESGLLCAAGPDVGHVCTLACRVESECEPGERCVVDRPSDLPARSLCGLVDPGTGEDGDQCTVNRDCSSNLCTAGACQGLCATDATCATGTRCLLTTGIRACGAEPVTSPRVDEFSIPTDTMSVDRPLERAFVLPADAVSFALWVRDLEGRELIASIPRLVAPDGVAWIDGNAWTIVRDQPIRELLAQLQINTVLAPSSDRLAILPGRYRYFAGLYNDRDPMTSVRTRRSEIVLRVKRAPGARLPATGNLRVRFYFAPGVAVTAATAPTNARLRDAVVGMTRAYQAVGIALTISGYSDLSGADAARFSVIDSREEIDEMFERRSSERADEVSVFFSRSIASAAGLSGAIGVAGDIVGPTGVQGTRHSGVVIGWDSTLNGGGARDLLSNTLTHEVGHYLGLWHTREQQSPCTTPMQMDCAPFGGVDPISDTATDNAGASRNTMYWQAAPGNLTLSAGQGTVLRGNVVITH